MTNELLLPNKQGMAISSIEGRITDLGFTKLNQIILLSCNMFQNE